MSLVVLIRFNSFSSLYRLKVLKVGLGIGVFSLNLSFLNFICIIKLYFCTHCMGCITLHNVFDLCHKQIAYMIVCVLLTKLHVTHSLNHSKTFCCLQYVFVYRHLLSFYVQQTFNHSSSKFLFCIAHRLLKARRAKSFNSKGIRKVVHRFYNSKL